MGDTEKEQQAAGRGGSSGAVTTAATAGLTSTPQPMRLSRTSVAVALLFGLMLARTARLDKLPTFDLSSGTTLLEGFANEMFGSEQSDLFARTVNETMKGRKSAETGAGAGAETDTTQEEIVDRRLTLEELLIHNGKQHQRSCPQGTTPMETKPSHQTKFASAFKIPLIIHQGYISSCIPYALSISTNQWSALADSKNDTSKPTFGYYFHDLDSMLRLIHQDWPEFAHMESVIDCIPTFGGLYDLWKALVLWEFGGVFAELDTSPQPKLAIPPTDDAVLSFKPNVQWASGDLIMLSPHHPVAYYAVQQHLNTLVGQKSLAVVGGTWRSPTEDMWKGALLWHHFDTGAARAPRRGFHVNQEYLGKQGKTFVGRNQDDLLVKNKNLGDQWRTKYFSREKETWLLGQHFNYNVTCMSITYDRNVLLRDKTAKQQQRRLRSSSNSTTTTASRRNLRRQGW